MELGHARGWGLEYGSLMAEIEVQPDFVTAIELAKQRGSLLSQSKLINLYMLLKFGLTDLGPGDVVEFGSYKGGSALFMAAVLRSTGTCRRVFALDTYEGMPNADPVRDLHQLGDFADADFNGFVEFTAANGLEDWLIPVKGLFVDTVPDLFASTLKVVLAHIDCDIRESVKYAIGASKPRMTNGGYLVFDDPLHGSCLGAMQAIEETLLHEDRLFAEQMYPHPVYRYPPLP